MLPDAAQRRLTIWGSAPWPTGMTSSRKRRDKIPLEIEILEIEAKVALQGGEGGLGGRMARLRARSGRGEVLCHKTLYITQR
jgi:hypothetical protein